MLVQLNFPRTFNHFLDDFFGDGYNLDVSSFPSIDIAQNENETVIVAEVPGVKKEDIKLSFEDGILTISGERRPYEIPQGSQLLLNEVRASQFKRAIKLPHEVDSNKISAELQNGLLRIVVPKAEAARPRTIKIQ